MRLCEVFRPYLKRSLPKPLLSICECFWWPFNILWRDSHYYGQKRWLMSKQMRCQGCRKRGGRGFSPLPSSFWAKQLTLSQPGGHHSTTNPPGFSDLATAQCAVRIRRQKNDVAIFSLSLLLQCTVSPFYFLRHFELTRITAYLWTFPKRNM